MKKGEQMELDLRSDTDIDLQAYTHELTSRLSSQLLEEGRCRARSRYEGYGILSACMETVAAGVKAVKKDMDELLDYLNSDDFNAAGKVANIDESMEKLIVEALKMSAAAKRVDLDLLMK